MPVSKAQQAAVSRYMKNHYDRVNLTLPKGEKALVKAHADAAGQSVNAFILGAVQNAMEPGNVIQGDSGRSEGAEGKPLLLAQVVDVAALKSHAEEMGESLEEFVKRAVENQIKRDEMALKLKGAK